MTTAVPRRRQPAPLDCYEGLERCGDEVDSYEGLQCCHDEVDSYEGLERCRDDADCRTLLDTLDSVCDQSGTSFSLYTVSYGTIYLMTSKHYIIIIV